jgi:hypothetical protein
MWSHDESLAEVHPHPTLAVTPKLPFPPVAAALALVGLIEYVQLSAA